MYNRSRRVCAAVSFFAAAGCTEPVEEVGPTADDGVQDRDADFSPIELSDDEVLARGLLPEDWIGLGLGGDLGLWTDLGPVEWVDSALIQENLESAIEAASATSPAAPAERDLSGVFFVLDVPNERAYKVEFEPEMMFAISDAVKEEEPEEPSLGLGGANDGAPIQSQQSGRPSNLRADQKYSKAPTRTQLPATTIFSEPWSALGHGRCTGTLMGSRTLITAAHCIVEYGEGNHQRWYSQAGVWDFTVNGTSERCMNSSTVDKAFVPAEVVLSNQSPGWYFSYDYALVSLTAPPSQINGAPAGCPSSPGTMFATALSDNELYANDYLHHGYPACFASGAPAGCATHTVWESAPSGAQAYPGNIITEGGVDVLTQTDAIVSEGHSGGPFWYFTSVRARLVGSQIGGDTTGNYTGLFRRVTATSLAQLSTWKCMAVPCI